MAVSKAEWARRDAILQKQIDTGTTVKPQPSPPAKPNPNANTWWPWFQGGNNVMDQSVQGSINAAKASRNWIKPLQDLGRMVDKYPIAPTVEAYQKQAAQEKLDWARWDLNKEKAGSQANRAAMGFGPAGGNMSINSQEAWIREHTLWNEGMPKVYVMDTDAQGNTSQRILGHPEVVRALFGQVVPQAEQARIMMLEAQNLQPPKSYGPELEATYQDWIKKRKFPDNRSTRTQFEQIVRSMQGGT